MEFLREKLNLRLYQQTILNTAAAHNTLVVLPTGLGKTHIAVALAALRVQTGKILFLAPTKPLVAQHLQTFAEYFNPAEELVLLTGEIEPDARKKLWENSQLIFSTPQTIRNDLLAGRINLREVSLIVFDEAHRAVGDYAYVFLAKAYVQTAVNPRILALTASPGSNESEINEIQGSLFIEKSEFRGREDPDVRPYVKEIFVEHKSVELPEEIKNIISQLDRAITLRVDELKRLDLLHNPNAKITRKAIILLQGQLQAQISRGDLGVARGLSICAALLKLKHAHALLESESLAAAKLYFESIWEQAKTTKVRAVKDIVSDFHVRVAYSHLLESVDKKIENPKLAALHALVRDKLAANPISKIIVFTEYRANIPKILEVLGDISGITIEKFVGQSSKSGIGMKQKEQIQVLNSFKSGEINCLVATAVAEEGLDIPQVDLVVFYTPIPSAIRNIQRRGRTGRAETGSLAILIAKGTKDELYHIIAKRKEKVMMDTLRNFTPANPVPPTLNDFHSKRVDVSAVTIYADSREHGTVIENLYAKGINVRVGQLKAGDFILSEDVGVERKIIEDFVNSLLDGRLFEQAKVLKSHFTQPLYIIEGNFADIFSVRNVKPQAIRGALISLILDWKIPILFSSSAEETANILATIAEREQLEKKKTVSVRNEHKPKSFEDMQQFFVEGLPSIGPSTAKSLLKHFGSPAKIVAATIEELQKVDGVGKAKAELIRKILDSESKTI